jgi:hypothetical protein
MPAHQAPESGPFKAQRPATCLGRPVTLSVISDGRCRPKAVVAAAGLNAGKPTLDSRKVEQPRQWRGPGGPNQAADDCLMADKSLTRPPRPEPLL